MFTAAFLKTTLEYMLLAFFTTFGGALVITTTPTLREFEAALVAGGMGALFALIKQLGAIQQASGILKVKVTPK